MAQLSIALLGPFQATRDENPLTDFETDPARALLAYLAMHPGTPFRRESLADLLWPEQPTAEALHALRQTLNRLRNAIGDRDTACPFLQVTRGTIQFNLCSDYVLDVTAFTDLITASKQHSHRRLECCRSCMQKLREAADLYRGDLLAGFCVNSLPFQEWLTAEREHLHQRAMDVFFRLAVHYEQRGAYDQVHHYAWRQVQLEPWCEEAHQQLMRALALSGQRSASLAQYRTCCHTLAQELGVEPAAETTALYERIRSEDLERNQTPRHNLPVQFTPFVGREAELTQIAELLNHVDCRLLTLIGPGGIGKTRLALQAAKDEIGMFRDGVYFISLSGISSPDYIVPALAQALQFSFDPKQDLAKQLLDYLREKELLLVLDGFEQLVAAAEQITDLLRHAPGVRALVTSRERLNLQAEWLYAVSGLDYPREESGETRQDWGAVRLFVQSARRVQPDFAADEPAVVRLCQLVEGTPLAIELAAAWAPVLSCHQIVQEIQKDLDFLQTSFQDVPERHRSVRAVFDFSWTMLTSEERAALCRLSVFRGGFDQAAASSVADVQPPLLAALADKSWLRQETHEQDALVRYGMHDLLQHYAGEKLADGPEAESNARDRHCSYYVAWLHQHEADLKDNAQRAALEEIGNEIKNVRTAWDWAIAQSKIAEMDMAWESLLLFYDLQSWFQEGEAAFERLAQTLGETQSCYEKIMLGRALACQGWLASRTGHYAHAWELLQQGLVLLQATGARRETALALEHLGVALSNLGKGAEAYDLCQAGLSIFQELGDSYNTAVALSNLGLVAHQQGDYPEAQQRCRASLGLAHAAKFRRVEANDLRLLGNISVYSGCYIEASGYYEQALSYYREINDQWGESATLLNLGASTTRQGDYVRGRACLEQALQIKQRIGDRQGEAIALENLGIIAAEQSNYSQARVYYEQALPICREIGDRRTESMVLGNLGDAVAHQGNLTSAWDYQEQALHIRRGIGDKWGETQSLLNLGDIATRQGDYAEAQDRLEQCLCVYHEIGDPRDRGVVLVKLSLLFHYLECRPLTGII